MLYLLDTDTVSAALKGRASVDRRLAQVAPVDWCISAVTRAELRYGVARRPQATNLARLVDGFLSVARTEAWGERAADEHGKLRSLLTVTGQRIGDFDEMIAAHALALSATLVTANVRHFRRVPGLQLENWVRP